MSIGLFLKELEAIMTDIADRQRSWPKCRLPLPNEPRGECPKCGIPLLPAMMYSCREDDCPTGLGPKVVM